MQVRAGQYSEDTVRVVVDIKSFDSYKVFSMSDPFRIIVDVWGDKSESSEDAKIAQNQESAAEDEPNVDANRANLSEAAEDELAIKRSAKKLTKTSAVTEDSHSNLDKIDKDKTDFFENSEGALESEESLSSKASTKVATKSSSPLVKIESETDSKDAEHLPVKKSLKASTMILSDATRKLLRESLAKQSEIQSKELPAKENAQTQSKKESVKVASKDNSKKEPQITTRVATKGTTRVVQQIAPGSNVDKIKASAIAKQLALGVKTIVIDPGHGGRDPGASGCSGGVYEKDIVLTISKKLASKIKSRLDCNVILTRSSDTYLTLEERTAIANTKNADLFISMHCNASNDSSLVGIETYYLNLATDERAINVAARENATSRKNISDLSSILNDLMKNAKINESSRLAAVVQSNLYSGIAKRYSHTKNLGVKQAPFYVLLGASMPSILIEASFISNPEECRRLTNSTYQDVLCDAITDGIAKYIRDTNPQRF
ncbi:MAG: N-acetylmuramoyl-L-alanine amidase [Desulfamplus sp.]|nr:N-acetylmuramoyl-L-alanine amidase [Desulfamplus sp.]